METQQDFAAAFDQSASIKHVVFDTVIGVFFGLALVSVISRAGARLHLRRRLSLDDYFLFAAAMFLSASVGIMYSMSDDIYLWMAIRKDLSLVYRIDPKELTQMLDNSVWQINGFLMIAWTATFLVKASFLAFFKQLIWQVDMIQRYYWGVVGLNVVSWMFVIADPFILCHDFGMESIKCMDPSKNTLYISLTGLVTFLDALTDLMIVSIPIILLRRSSIRFSQKVVLGIFMSLSLVMVIIAIVRCAKIYGKDGVDLPWEFFWQCMEANVAVLMSSLTVFRTLLTHESKKRVDDRKRKRAAGPRSNFKSSLSVRVWRILNVKGKRHEDLESQDGLPEIPGATMTGLRTFIRRNQRDGGHTVIDDNMTKTSQTDTLDGRDGTFVYTQEKLSNSDRTDGIWGSQDSATVTWVQSPSQTQRSVSSDGKGLPRFSTRDHSQ